MLQNIIVFSIIIIAVGYSAYAIIKNLSKKESSGCDGCSGCEIKKEILQNVKTFEKNSGKCGCA